MNQRAKTIKLALQYKQKGYDPETSPLLKGMIEGAYTSKRKFWSLWLLFFHPTAWLLRTQRLFSKAPGCTWSRWKIRRIANKVAKKINKNIKEGNFFDCSPNPAIDQIIKRILLNGKDHNSKIPYE